MPSLNPDGTVAAVDLDELNEPSIPAHLRADAIVACTLCDDEGYRGLVVCDHVDPDTRAPSGRAAARAAMEEIQRAKAQRARQS